MIRRLLRRLFRMGGVPVKPEPRFLRLGDVHESPAGVRCWVFDRTGADVVMRPMDATTPKEHVTANIADVAYAWPRVEDSPGSRVIWIEPKVGRG